MDNNEAKYYNALNVLHNGSYAKLQTLLGEFQSWENAYNQKLKNGESIDADKEWQKLKDKNISLITKENAGYPALLKEISSPPLGIYVLGNLSYNQPAAAIVGTRKASPQGKELAYSFAKQLSAAGIPIISGFVIGIDESAHRGALDAEGKTIAVLGTPLDNIYPKQNEKVAESILEKNGAIISEYHLNYRYHPSNFLIRNRIISGLSNAAVIIEAPEKSGAIATAGFANEQNREVFVVPGNITSPNYRGSNKLIKDGAMLITDIQDIFDYFNFKNQPAKIAAQGGNDDEKKIISIFQSHSSKKITADQLLGLAGTNLSNLNKILAMLVIKGIVKESNGEYFL